MKLSTKFLTLLFVLGLVYSIYKLFTGHGGSGLGDFIDGISYTSIILFIVSLAIVLINIRHLRKHIDTFIFLLLGLPMTIIAINGFIYYTHYNRTPDLIAKYPRPVSQKVFTEDSLHISAQVDSLIALRNRETHGTRIVSGSVDTIIYSQTGNEIFVIYMQQFEPNNLGNDLDPAYLSAEVRDSIFWHLQEGPPNAVNMSGSYHNVAELKKAVRKFYFNQYSFADVDSLKANYFWKRKINK